MSRLVLATLTAAALSLGATSTAGATASPTANCIATTVSPLATTETGIGAEVSVLAKAGVITGGVEGEFARNGPCPTASPAITP